MNSYINVTMSFLLVKRIFKEAKAMARESFLSLLTCLFLFQYTGATERLCYSEACNVTVANLFEYMDFGVDPCNDFYGFTCGKFLKNYNLPEDRLRVSSYQFLDDELNDKLKDVLEEPIGDGAPLFEAVTKTFYKSCINIEAIEEGDILPVMKMFDFFEGWPVMENNWDESKANLTDFLIRMKHHGFMELFAMIVYVEETDSTLQLPVMFQPEVTFQLDAYGDGLSGDKINSLRAYITQMVQLLTNFSSSYQITRDIEDMLEFEVELSKILVGPEEMRFKRQELTTLANITEKFKNSLQFDVYVRAIFREAGIEVSSNQLMELYYPSYINELPNLLEKTRPRVVINYLLWKFINELVPAMPRRFVLLKDEFTKSVYGITGGVPRWKKCLGTSNDILPGPVGALYSKKHFRSSAKEKMLNMIGELKNAFSNMLSDNLWMTEETKLLAREKANFMIEKIGYPDEYMESDFYEDVLEGVVMNINSFLDNWLTLRKYTTIENLKHLQKPIRNSSFLMPVANVNSYYFPNLNAIEFPAGILQYPFFNEEMPMYQNFGGIGYIIGHEITHGFDDSGRLYNKDGNAVNWWKEEDTQKFKSLIQCFIDLYDGFVVSAINETVNGRLTLGENIADAGGLRESFLAYKSWIDKFGSDPLLPNFNYSAEQMFFIHFGKINCMKARPEIERHLIKTDNHSPAEFRVNGAVMNLREFSETFQCPVGSPMNPREKCHIW